MNKTKKTKPFLIGLAVFITVHIVYGLTIYTSEILASANNFSSTFPLKEYIESQSILGFIQYVSILITATLVFNYATLRLALSLKSRTKTEVSISTLSALTSLLASIALIRINFIYFPTSVYAKFDDNEILSVISYSILAITFANLIITHWKTSIVGFLLILTSNFYHTGGNHSQKQNIIIVGIDSLRPELIKSHMPFLSNELEESIVFENTYTLFARTYPSWISILTGRAPVHNGARFNLIPDNYLAQDNQYLPSVLAKQGYYSVYASDERRFSNLNESHGFNKIIGPKTGANDFLLGKFSDYPLINLLSLFPIGKWLLPEIYANRAADQIYYPEKFSDNLRNEIRQFPDQPIFLAVHYCLAHWPYTDASHKADPNYKENPNYPDNLRKIDIQINRLYSDLDKKGILTNSKIIFLSDHGESWGTVHTGIHAASDNHELTVFDIGHGMNILSNTSHKVLLAFKNYDLSYQENRLASLIDIYPTMLDELHIPFDNAKIDGQSLKQPLSKPVKLAFESGVTLSVAYQIPMNIDAIANEGIQRFNVLKDGHLRLKDSAIKEMTNNKQVGLRIDDEGIFIGKLITPEESIIHIDYAKKLFSEIDNINNSVVSENLRNEFCKTFKRTREIVKEMCH